MNTRRKVLLTGAGGFIGHHLVSDLKAQGHWVRGVDLKHPEHAATGADEFSISDLREIESCLQASRGIDTVFALAADMGGMGFISQNHSQIFYNNALINLHTLEAARRNGVERYLFSSSACIYPEFLQEDADVRPLREDDAYPAQPQDAYGWEKLMSERVALHYRDDHGIDMRIARFITSTARSARGRAGARRLPRRSAARSRLRKRQGIRRLRFGGMANRRARSAISMIASKGCGG